VNVRRPKPYVCVDCDYADHFRFQDTADVEAAAGTWLRCLAHSRAQEQDGVVKASWLRRTFRDRFDRVEELVRVGLLRQRGDGDYEIHAYAPRNQTRAMLEEARAGTRKRMSALRKRERAEKRRAAREDVTPHMRVTDALVTRVESAKHIAVTDAIVPTSTSINTSLSSSSDLDQSNGTEIRSSEAQRGGAPRPLPSSERGLSGPYWLEAFSQGISAHTGRPCSVGRMYLSTLERMITHHAPSRDAARVCEWLRSEAKAFAAKWDGKHPPKGLTPDGLERWLNEGRGGPPEFGPKRIVQLPPEEWHGDDFGDLGAEVVK
jgi:hypothetical protein